MREVEHFIYRLEEPRKSLVMFLDELMMQYPQVSSKIRYKIPFYYGRSRICYINPLRNNGVELAFVRP